jgi:hypothetical protein
MKDLKKVSKKTPKSIIKWSWVLILAFFALSFFDVRFALAGFLCMAAPIGFAAIGRGKVHCSHYCPRGSFFGKFLPFISMNKTLPAFMNTRWFKHGLLFFMFSAFGMCLYRMGWGYENVGRAVLSMMLRSFLVGAVIGTVFMPRSWCKICPMGHATGLLRDMQKPVIHKSRGIEA